MASKLYIYTILCLPTTGSFEEISSKLPVMKGAESRSLLAVCVGYFKVKPAVYWKFILVIFLTKKQFFFQQQEKPNITVKELETGILLIKWAQSACVFILNNVSC